MPHVLTIYNHGTTVDQTNSNHTITKLHDTTQFIHKRFVTQGVGSQMKDGGAFGGTVFGAGVKDNVVDAVTWVEAQYQELGGGAANNFIINICGFSRGAVTCFMQANRLFRKGSTQAIKDIPVRIFAIDPVPGCAGAPNSHMYKHIELTANVTDCRIVIAETERRAGFRPVLHNEFFDGNKKLTHIWHQMPGNHAGIVNKTAIKNDSYKIVKDMAKRFLNECPRGHFQGKLTRFDDETFMSDQEILGRYSRIMLDFDEYKAMGYTNADTSPYGGDDDENKVGGLWGLGMDHCRKVQVMKATPLLGETGMNKDKWKVGMKIKCKKFGRSLRFFVNEDHNKRFKQAFPMAWKLISEIERGEKSGVGRLVDANSAERREMNGYLGTALGQTVWTHLYKYKHAVERL